mmetsp:Transcript_21548/g.44958  ORF Transcript_21548/g.44958 Transcript_21548/m.44958 type:complete len:92 (+) Transcript_21548:74-349(+)|eukprot:CAMPEP_0172453090 /NCGR_PEP_ID=MMETSP1065-20121228/10562_1 /TAXON_ID=265537 /ORGANISM="Amphiprora paludosa, Strain CCMP125" /LENGTH=91 /DNA_ID=CAMNT_0013205255 /DNA_START=78 /DNA_END=353 /DNA_ORIENTATION=+
MSPLVARAMARKAQPAIQMQRRTFLDWMVNYPDKINELKKVHQAGGRKIFTWQKQPTDKISTGIALALVGLGTVQLVPGMYRLATGTGKMD